MYGNKTGPIVDGQINKHNVCPSLPNGKVVGFLRQNLEVKTKEECLRMNAQLLCTLEAHVLLQKAMEHLELVDGVQKTQRFMVKELVVINFYQNIGINPNGEMLLMLVNGKV